jgi:4-hydroxy-3-methylbut-2-enyl diphosphate reductase
VDELPRDLAGTVAVTAGASAPESLVNEVIAALAPHDGVTVESVTVEDEYFPPPPELRETLRTLGALVDLVFGATAVTEDPAGGDRTHTAASVLEPVM